MPDRNNKNNPMRERFANMVDFSKDVILDTFVIRITGTYDLVIENYKGILEYTDARIRIKAKPKNIKVCGTSLEIKTITDDILLISGQICDIEFTEE